MSTSITQIIAFATLLTSAFAEPPLFLKVGNGCCSTTDGKKMGRSTFDKFTSVSSLAECQKFCADSPACSGVEYTKKNGGVCKVHTQPVATTSRCKKVHCYIAIQPVVPPPPLHFVAPPAIIETSSAPTPAPTTTSTTATTTTSTTATTATTAASTAAAAKTCTVYPGVDFYGGDLVSYNRKQVKTVSQCAKKCLANSQCAKFTYAWKQCFLKTSAAGYNVLPDAVSAICEFPTTPAAPATTIGTSTPPLVTSTAAPPTSSAAVPTTAAPTTAAPTTAAPTPTTAAPTTTSTAVPTTEARLPEKDVSLRLVFPRTSTANLYTKKLEAQGGAVNGKLYVFGGFINGYKYMDKETWEFNPNNKKWRKRAPIPSKWTGATHMANAVDEETGSIYLLGGITVTGQNKFPKGAMGTSDVFRFDAAKNTWSTLPSLPEARGGGAAVVLNNKLHFFNGAKFDGPHGGFQEDMATHWQLDLADVSAGWKTLAPNSLGRNHVGGTTWGGKIYAIGGQFHEEEGCSNQQLAEVYNPKTDVWSRIADLPIGTGHISPATLSHEHGIIVVGGVTDKNNGCRPPGYLRKQLFFYNPTTDTWTEHNNPHAGASRVSGIINGKIWSQHDSYVNDIQLNWSVTNVGASYAVGANSANLEVASVEAVAATTAASGRSADVAAISLAAFAGVCAIISLVLGVLTHRRQYSSRTISSPHLLP